MGKTLLAIWQFVAGDSRSAPLGVALAVAAALALERAGAPAWSVPLVFTICVAGALLAALRETA